MQVEEKAYARAGLLGNPSDGYFGKAIAVTIKDFEAKVFCHESNELMIQSSQEDIPVYKNVQHLVERVELYGYYGGMRLIKAAIKKFTDYCRRLGIRLAERNFTIGYTSNIPRQLGLGGSSAIVVAAFRALTAFYEVDIPIQVLPTLVLEAERDELGIQAGFMDRVVQVYGGCVYMDLDEKFIREKGHGLYERLNPGLLPKLYLAYRPALGKVSGRVHRNLRERHEQGDPLVRRILRLIAGKAEEGREALLRGDCARFRRLMDENFDLRRRIIDISPGDAAMVDAARDCGASAKFAGSGGSIIGTYEDEKMYARLEAALREAGATVIKPLVG